MLEYKLPKGQGMSVLSTQSLQHLEMFWHIETGVQ